jgi:Kef-type K+ transport system membrane component KefB
MNSASQGEQILLAVLVQLIVILMAARLVGALFSRLGQPQVCGEIAAGFVLGPSLFGRFFPNAFQSVFNPAVGTVFSMFSHVGLILLLFLVGLEFDFSHVRNCGKKAISISLAGILLPFTLGFVTARALYPSVGKGIEERGFALFLATAISITALPVLGRILIEFNLQRTKLGALTITAAAADDAAGWTILAIVSAIVKSDFQLLHAGIMVLEVLSFTGFMMFVARPFLVRWARHIGAELETGLSLTSLAIVIAVVFGAAVVTNLIGIFSVFGGFLAGAVLSDQTALREAIRERLRDFTTVFFLPIFFTYTGLRTDIGTMDGGRLWALLGLVLLVAIAGKFGGCALAARLSGFSLSDACAVGVLMNTRGLMELVAVNIGFDLGLIPRSVFFMLVVMAIVTTFMTSPILRRLMRSSQLEALFVAADPMRRATTPPALEHAS